MPRLLDWDCSNESCGHKVRDEFVMEVPDTRQCEHCRFPMVRAYYVSRTSRNAEWSDRDAVVVFKDASGKISYPARNDKPTPAGCERVVMRSLAAVTNFERQHKVTNEAMHFDRNGRGVDDTFRGKEYSH